MKESSKSNMSFFIILTIIEVLLIIYLEFSSNINVFLKENYILIPLYLYCALIIKYDYKYRCFFKYNTILSVLLVVISSLLLKITYNSNVYVFISIMIVTLASLNFLLWDVFSNSIKSNTEDEINNDHDHLFRTYYAERLEDHIRTQISIKDSSSKKRIFKGKKIAILGEWGSGKTFILKILRKKLRAKYDRPEYDQPSYSNNTKESELHLEKDYYPTAWINPWKAKNENEAWQILSQGIEYAYYEGRLPIWNQFLKLPILKHIATFFKIDSEITKATINFLKGSYSDCDQDSILALNKKIASKKKQLVIFIDDMERASSNIVKAILPVLDRASELNNIIFICALDESQLNQALTHNSSNTDNKQLTEGYLDKVFETHWQIPQPTSEAIKHFITIYQREHFPIAKKLERFLNQYYHLMPSNPRQLIKIINSLAFIEILFLIRYDNLQANDINIIFVTALIEHIHPDIHEEWRKNLTGGDSEYENSFINVFSYDDLFGPNRSQTTTTDTIPLYPATQNILNISNNLLKKIQQSVQLYSARVEERQSQGSLEMLIFALNHGYKQRQILSLSEQEKVISTIYHSNCSYSILDAIQQVYKHSPIISKAESHLEIWRNMTLLQPVQNDHLEKLLQKEKLYFNDPSKSIWTDAHLRAWIIGQKYLSNPNNYEETKPQLNLICSLLSDKELNKHLWENYGQTLIVKRQNNITEKVKINELLYNFKNDIVLQYKTDIHSEIEVEIFDQKLALLTLSLYDEYLNRLINRYKNDSFLELESFKGDAWIFVHKLYEQSNPESHLIYKFGRINKTTYENIINNIYYILTNDYSNILLLVYKYLFDLIGVAKEYNMQTENDSNILNQMHNDLAEYENQALPPDLLDKLKESYNKLTGVLKA